MKKTDKSVDQDIWNHPDRLRKWTIERLQRLDSDAYPNHLPSLLDTPGNPRLTWEARYLAEERAADEQIRNELRRVKKNRPEDYDLILSDNPGLKGYLQSVRGRPKGHQLGLEQAWGGNCTHSPALAASFWSIVHKRRRVSALVRDRCRALGCNSRRNR